MKKRVFVFVAVLIVLCMQVLPAMAAGTVYPDNGMSTSSSKYYAPSTTASAENIFGSTLYTYRFRPVWRVNKSNSIYATNSASCFSKGNVTSLWKLVDAKSSWYSSHCSGSRITERYYAEGAVVGWGLKVKGTVSISGTGGTISASSDATLGQVETLKYQGIAYTGTSWSSCKYGYRLYY